LTDHNGWTAAHYACFHGRLGCLQLLVRWGASIDETEKDGNTPGILNIRYYNVLCYMLCVIILYYTMLYYNVLCYIVLYYIVLDYIISYFPYRAIKYYKV